MHVSKVRVQAESPHGVPPCPSGAGELRGRGGVAWAPAVLSCPGLSLEALSLRGLGEGGVEVGFTLTM